ncbi:protein SdhA [Legionella maioricensis]|uniref:protein SdhA n=1 Tax=Legionella maioricensis TaxID=2896528 RepID=UPI00253F7A35|nr:protein SdhA [Legionella maioricensis]
MISEFFSKYILEYILASGYVSEYIELVESFKKNQISKIIETVNAKIFETLDSPKFNPRIAPYFANRNKEGVPFTDFSLDPDNISQIKKVINALYHAHLTFVDLENVDLRNPSRTTADLQLLYGKTIHEAYEASYLLTHLDVDIKDMFSEEFSLILPYINDFQAFIKRQSTTTQEIAEKYKEFPISYKAGEITGVAIEQMQPNSGDLDYNFLTQFSADLPGYIDKVTQYISKYSSQIIEKEPLSKEKIEELQDAAFKLLNDLENLKGNRLFLSFKVLKYIHIIRNIITLSMSSLEQMGNLSDSSQDVIRDNLALLKYSVLPELFGLVDKIEDNAMLKPGTFSAPLMEKVKPLYDLLIYYASKPVNFQEKGEELLSIEDSRFLALRLEGTFKRIDRANKALFKINKAQDALTDFYLILDDPQFRDMTLSQLPQETKNQLIEHYKVIKPYMMHIDGDFNNLIIRNLQDLGEEDVASYLSKQWRWLKGERPADHVSFVLEKKSAVQDLISKKIATQEFHIALNRDLIDSVQKQTNLVLFPYSDKANIFTIDESTALNLNSLLLHKKAQKALADFYRVLNEPRYRTAAIYELPKETKDQLIKHYELLRPYITQVDPEFNELVTQILFRPQSWASFLSKPWPWIKNKTPEEHVGFILEKKDNLERLIAKKIADEPTSLLQFKKEDEHNLLVNPEQLSADHALDLYQWYRNKHSKFMIARNAYNEFIALLKRHPQTRGDVLHINNLNQATKAQCRNLYNLFQPYFINGMPKERRAAALVFDSYLVHSLSNKVSPTQAPPVNLFAEMNEYFQVYFTQIDINWNKKSRAYLRCAREKFESENEASPLEPETNTENRAYHLIPHTKYSKFIREFRTTLLEMTATFNDAMRAELTPKQNVPLYQKPVTPVEEFIEAFNKFINDEINAIPFPELEDKNQTLSQSKQVVAIKRIFNAVYHIEGIVRELEDLTNRQYESEYVYHLLQAYGHINEIKELAEGLAADPHFGLIGRELLEKAQTIFATIQEHSDPYQVSPDEVPTEGTVQYSGLWYTLNAFFIIPKHIRALNNSNYLTTEELDELHVCAKKSAVRIEKIISNSNSYFKLFLQTPNMYRLYRDLTNKLNEFVSTSHDTMMDNLDKFRAEFITPMLLEADLWEDKLGLKPGTLSETLKKITDEYYKGLLHPLSLNSATHIALICDKAPIEKRISITNKKIDSATLHIAKLEKNYKHVEHLYELITKYENFNGGLLPTSDLILNLTRAELVETYKKALPKLVKLQKKIDIQASKKATDYQLDDLLNSEVSKYEPKLTQIKAVVASCHHYYLGVKATYQMQLNTATEKLTYLNKVKTEQEQDDLLFVEEYTKESFNKHLEALCNRHIGLQYTDKEYRKKLKAYLLTFKEQIINESRTAEDINLTIRNLLKEKISLFEKENFAQHYHLDTVRVALAQFKNYFSLSNSAIENGTSVFESDDTLERKSDCINRLIGIAENEELSIDTRFEQIKLHVRNPNFERIILAHKHESYFSFTYLKQCLISLLEILHLYTPTRKALFYSLSDAVNNKPRINELTKRFGLFAASSITEECSLPIEAGVEASAGQTDEEPKRSLAEEWNTKGRRNMLMFRQRMQKTSDEVQDFEEQHELVMS